MNPNEKALVDAFARAIEAEGGKSLLVGGIVRDELLGLPSKDVDFEIFGLPMEKVNEILSQFGNVMEVGKQFGILTITELDWDVALPRREKKTGEGHRGFEVVPDHTMSIEEAAHRRDLTINALSKDPLTGEIIDPLNGMADLKAGILRAADPLTFSDDPLRALRVAQFAARFDFDVEPQTLQLVAAQPLEELPGERILPEFSKMLVKGQKPSKGIEVLRQANLLRYFPEIEALQGVPQSPEWHPEGDVYIHTMMVLDEAAKQRTGDPSFDLPLMLGALAHDFGKPATTEEIDGKITSRGHEEAGVAPTKAFLKRMKAPLALTKQVETLVDTHLRPAILPGTSGRKGYRKLGRTLSDADVSPELLAALSKADVLGRTTDAALRRDVSSQDKFLEDYHQHVTSQAPPGGKLVDSVSGKHLIAKGFKPGPDMGKFLALTRSIEDETGITDPEALIDLAARFLSDRSNGGDTQDKENQCGDSHIREGEECFDGNYRDERKRGNTKSTLATDLDWAVGRPCEDGHEEYPEKCTGPGSSAENPSGPHDAPDTQWDLPTEDTTPYQGGEELGLPRELEEVPQVPEPQQQIGPDAWNLPFSPEELNDPRQNALDEKMLKKTEKDFAKKQNAADKAMLKKTQEDQKAQKAAEKEALKQQQQAAKQAKEQTQKLKQAEQEYDKYLAGGSKSQVPQGMDFKEWLEYIFLGPDEEKAKSNTPALGTGKGPSAFRTHPDETQPDFLLNEQFDWQWKNGETTQHPGLANVTAEPQRRHRRHNEYPGVKDFDRGSRFSEHPLEGPLGRDGFGGSTPHGQGEAPTLPNGMTPETGIFPEAESDLHGHGQPDKAPTHPREHDIPELPATDPHEFDAIEYLDWDTPPTTSDIGPDHREPFEGSDAFPKSEYPNDKGAGFLATELPHPQLLDEALPNPSPPRSASSQESPQSSGPGQFVSYPGGGGLDRVPMAKPRGAPQETGFLPVQNLPDPAANMFKASAGGRAAGVPDTNFDAEDLEKGTELEMWEHGVDEDMGKDVAKDHLFDHPRFYDKKGKFEEEKGKAKADLDSNFDQHELKLGFQKELESDDTSSDKAAKELAKDNISSDQQHYSKRSKLSDISNKEKMQDKVEPVEAFNPEDVQGPGGQNPGGVDHMDRQRSGRGGGTKIRPYWDMDFTGKKSGFMSIDLPTENVYPAETEDVEAARTMEDLRNIDAIFPKNFTNELGQGQPGMAPSLRHRNERSVAPDPIKDAENYGGPVKADDDSNVEQKQVQPLTPNQKMGIAVDPKGPMGERIVIMFPMFEEASPAIMALRSHRFEKHGGVVVDGPPEWLISVVPMLESVDSQSAMDGADDLFARVRHLLDSRGLTIEYEQEPRP